jgi:hypothetical protein
VSRRGCRLWAVVAGRAARKKKGKESREKKNSRLEFEVDIAQEVFMGYKLGAAKACSAMRNEKQCRKTAGDETENSKK